MKGINVDSDTQQEIQEKIEIRQTQFITDFKNIITAIGGMLIFLSFISLGIRMILSRRSPEKRTELITTINYILIGVIILGSLMLATGFIVGFIEDIRPDFITNINLEESKLSDVEMEEDRGNFLTNAITALLNLIINFFTWLQNSVSPNGEFEGVISMILREAMDMPNAPFTTNEWHFLNTLYLAVSGVIGLFIMIMIGKTGVEYIAYSSSPGKREKLSNSIQRWILMGIFLAFAPIFVEAITKLFNIFTLGLYSSFVNKDIFTNLMGQNMINNIKTSSKFTTAIAQALYLYVEVKMLIILQVRKVMLTVMYAFTPIAICLWGISDRSYASAIWFGEMITNLSMGLFYSFSIFVMIGALQSSGSLNNWFLVIIWMMCIVPVTKVLRNSLQGLFIMIAGVDEEALGSSAVGVLGRFAGTTAGMVAGMSAAMTSTFRGRTEKNPENIFNRAQYGNVATESAGQTQVNTETSGRDNIAYENKESSKIGSNTIKMPQQDQSIDSIGGKTIGTAAAGINNKKSSGNEYAQQLIRNYNKIANSSAARKAEYAGSVLKTAAKVGGAFVGGSAKLIFGHDMAFNNAINNINSAGRLSMNVGEDAVTNIKAGMAGVALNRTINEIIENDGCNYNEALAKIFNRETETDNWIESIRAIGDLTSSENGMVPGKVVYNTKPYTSIDGYSFK